MVRKRGGINSSRANWEYVFSPAARARLHRLLELDEAAVPAFPVDENSSEDYTDAFIRSLSETQILVATWGAHPLTDELLKLCPDLELVVYAAGSVKALVTPELVARGIPICSAVHLNARPVAEFVFGLVVLSLKDLVGFNRRLRSQGPAGWNFDKVGFAGGAYGTTVGLLGYGRVTEQLLPRLKTLDVTILLEDPHLTHQDVRELGAEPAGVEEIMRRADVVSLHHGDTPRNRRMIGPKELDLLKPGSHFINTARGRLVDETALVERLTKGDITAYLDVTSPEPPAEGHPFYTLENCILTPHIAGSLGREVHRMGDYAVREVEHWLRGEPLENQLDLKNLDDRA